MKKRRVLLTGGGSGGHISPLLAVAEELRRQDTGIRLYYLGPKSKLNEELSLRGIKIYNLAGAKLRRYFDPRNIIDIPKFFFGFLQALFKIYFIMPDVVFSKGGTGALPVVLAARFYFVPVLIHDSDSVPGLTNKASSRFAKRVFVSFKTAEKYFPATKTEFVGNPIRTEILTNRPPDKEAGKALLGFNKDEPLVVFLGGSQGATRLNEFVFNNFEELTSFTQVFHQVGDGNLNDAERLKNSSKRYRYGGFISAEEMKFALAGADIVVSRAGSAAIFEIASFGKPAILVPLPEAASDHQRINAYEYERAGAAVVLEENNLSWGILKLEIEKILGNQAGREEMSRAARNFARPEASEIVARRILEIL